MHTCTRTLEQARAHMGKKINLKIRIQINSETKPVCVPYPYSSSFLDEEEKVLCTSHTSHLLQGWHLGVTYHMMTSWTKCSSFLSPLQVAHVLFPLAEHVLHLWPQ